MSCSIYSLPSRNVVRMSQSGYFEQNTLYLFGQFFLTCTSQNKSVEGTIHWVDLVPSRISPSHNNNAFAYLSQTQFISTSFRPQKHPNIMLPWAPPLCLTFRVLQQFQPLSVPPHILIQLALIDRLNRRKYVRCNQ